jgi:hypothetical protein
MESLSQRSNFNALIDNDLLLWRLMAHECGKQNLAFYLLTYHMGYAGVNATRTAQTRSAAQLHAPRRPPRTAVRGSGAEQAPIRAAPHTSGTFAGG